MTHSETLAIAAHLHVLLRRKTGRVTDTEWMAVNTDYALEIVRFARLSARADGHADLGDWADRLEAAVRTVAAPKSTVAQLFAPAAPPEEHLKPPSPADRKDSQDNRLLRYVRGIR
jgi:hypothetical protein